MMMIPPGTLWHPLVKCIFIINIELINVCYFKDFTLEGEMFEGPAKEHFTLQSKILKITLHCTGSGQLLCTGDSGQRKEEMGWAGRVVCLLAL